MHYLLDGYNLAHWLAGGADLDSGELRDLLVRRLPPRIPRDADSVRVFWDRKSNASHLDDNVYGQQFDQHFVPDADAAIIDRVHGAAAPQEMVAVSGDREVTGRSRQLGGQTMTPRQFFGGGRR